MRKLLYSSLVACAFLFSACDSSGQIDSNVITKNKIKEREFVAQNFTLVTVDEKFIPVTSTKEGLDFDEYKGKKAVLIDIFATWCPPCIDSLPVLKELKEKYNDEFEIVSVLFQDDISVEDMKAFIEKHGINYPITMGDENARFADEFNVKKVPEMFLFSKEGKFVNNFIGETSKEKLENFIEMAIKN